MAICLNKRYDGDRDPNDGRLPSGRQVPFLEIGLKSECVRRWYGFDFIQTIENHSGFETYDVDWASAGCVAVALGPGKKHVCRTSSGKSCVDDDKGVQNTRVAPTKANTVSYNVAPACVPGWVILDELSDLLSMERDKEDDSPDNVVSLVASLTSADLDDEDPDPTYVIRSELELSERNAQFIYRFKVRNLSNEDVQFHVDSMRSPDFPEGFKGSLCAGETATEEFAMKGDSELGRPAESTGTGTLFDGCHAHELTVSTLLPVAWTPGLVEIPQDRT